MFPVEGLIVMQLRQWRVELAERVEGLRVRWALLDAEQRQAAVLIGVYLAYTLLDIASARARFVREDA